MGVGLTFEDRDNEGSGSPSPVFWGLVICGWSRGVPRGTVVLAVTSSSGGQQVLDPFSYYLMGLLDPFFLMSQALLHTGSLPSGVHVAESQAVSTWELGGGGRQGL